MSCRSVLVSLSLVALGLRANAQRPPAPSSPPRPNDVMVGSTPATVIPLVNFVPDLLAIDGQFECGTREAMGANLTSVSASFPSAADTRETVVVMFDSTRRIVRVAERRGPPLRPAVPLGQEARATPSQIAAAARAVRSTTITLDYSQGRAILANRGGGFPDQMAMGSADVAGSLDQLGRPLDRAGRVLEQCAGK